MKYDIKIYEFANGDANQKVEKETIRNLTTSQMVVLSNIFQRKYINFKVIEVNK
jgi:hypothetical protein